MAGIPTVEAKAKRSKKAVAHIEIHPKMDGGHIVKHVYHGYDHQPTEYHFNAEGKSQGGEHILSHLEKHANLPGYAEEEGYDKRDKSETEEDV